MGIRKAPVPLYGNSVKQLPAVRQDFVLHPALEIDSQDLSLLTETVLHSTEGQLRVLHMLSLRASI